MQASSSEGNSAHYRSGKRLFLATQTPYVELLQDHDWASSALGMPHGWCSALRSATSLVLDSPTPMWLAWGPDLGMVYNEAYARILGAKHPVALGAPLKEVWAEIWDEVSALVETALQGRALHREDMPLTIRRFGHDEQTWFSFTYTPLLDDAGDVQGLICSVWETTEKVLAQHHLAESEKRLKALTLASTNVVYRMSADWSSMTKLNGHQFIRSTREPDPNWLSYHILPDDIEEFQSAVGNAIANRSTFQLEHRIRQTDGNIGWSLSRAVPILDCDGEIVEWFGTATDVTVQHEAAELLQQQNRELERRIEEALVERRFFSAIVESTDAMVQVIDMEGCWLACNQAAKREFASVHGFEPRIGQNLFESFAAGSEPRKRLESLWRPALSGKESNATVELLALSGEPRVLEFSFRILRDSAGVQVGAYHFAVNVTERRREQRRLQEAEEALRHSQKLESLGQLTGGVAHDFNNLLQVISSGLTVLDRMGHGSSEASQRAAASMRRAVERGKELTRHLLAFARRAPVRPQVINVDGQLMGMRDMLSRSLSGNTQVDISVGPDIWNVEVDPGEFEVALLNLCINARDAMPGGGVISIHAKNMENAELCGRRVDVVSVVVGDTGMGMSADVQRKAFEPFFTTKETGKGSGLGLPQVYGFVSQAGGEVRIESAPGKGTSIHLLLPRSHGARDADTPASQAHLHQALSGRVLLVEDDEDVAATTMEALRSLGLDVEHVPRVAAALQRLEREPAIDLVLSDVMLPDGQSGVDLAAAIKDRWPRLPVVLATGFQNSVPQEFAGRVHLLLKPYSVQALASAIAAQLRVA